MCGASHLHTRAAHEGRGPGSADHEAEVLQYNAEQSVHPIYEQDVWVGVSVIGAMVGVIMLSHGSLCQVLGVCSHRTPAASSSSIASPTAGKSSHHVVGAGRWGQDLYHRAKAGLSSRGSMCSGLPRLHETAANGCVPLMRSRSASKPSP